MNAVELLTADHRNVDELFQDYEAEKDTLDESDKEARVAAICLELTLHAMVEEELFYPAARSAIHDRDAQLLDEAEVEHASIKNLICQLSEMSPSDHMYEAKVKVLSEYVRHHVQEEENEIFLAVRDAKLDVETLGQEITQRKDSLRVELTAEPV